MSLSTNQTARKQYVFFEFTIKVYLISDILSLSLNWQLRIKSPAKAPSKVTGVKMLSVSEMDAACCVCDLKRLSLITTITVS